MYYINGSVLEGKRDGIPRYALNVLLELDKLITYNSLCIVFRKVPEDCTSFKNIKIVIIEGNPKGWFFVKFIPYVIKHRGRMVNFNFGYCLPKSVVCVHDARPAILKRSETKKSVNRYILTMNIVKILASKIVTSSNYSKNEISRLFKIDEDRFVVAGNGWEHLKSIEPDYKVLSNYNIEPYSYFYSLGSQAPHKNFKWVYEVAKRNPMKKFVIAGGVDTSIWGKSETEKLNNVIYLGFVSDAENVALMKKAKMFLFPSLYEGFGIPPLEALSCGCPIALAKTTCLPEIYKNSAVYFDPYDYEVDLDLLASTEVSDSSKILMDNTWINAAKAWKEILSL